MENTPLTWKIKTEGLPVVIRNCPKCGNNAKYANSGKFRVNANKRNLDIWLIYYCEKCKSTYNLTIYERIAPQELSNSLLERFMNNDPTLSKEYGFDAVIHKRNKAEQSYETVNYCIDGENAMDPEKQYVVSIEQETPSGLRLDKIISEKSYMSRNSIQKAIATGRVRVDSDVKYKSKISRNLTIFIG